jgi:hypothetical protein
MYAVTRRPLQNARCDFRAHFGLQLATTPLGRA